MTSTPVPLRCRSPSGISTPFCRCTPNDTQYRATNDRGGLYITSEGTLEALFIFIQFQDDWDSTGGWPTYVSKDSMALPPWANDFVGQGNRLTQYYSEMSNGVLNLTGYVYPNLYVTNHPQNYYSNLANVNQEVLTVLDGSIDYSE